MRQNIFIFVIIASLSGCSSDFIYQLEPNGEKYCVPSELVREDPLFGYGGREKQEKPGDFLISNCLRYDPRSSAEKEGCWINDKSVSQALVTPSDSDLIDRVYNFNA